MPRLTNEHYYHRHELLRWLWLNRQTAYSYLSPKEQWTVHDYFQPSKALTFQELVAHRREVSKERPNLPATASKAANQLYQLVKGQRAPRPATHLRHQPRHKRQVAVRAVARPEIDVEKLVRALLEISRHKDKRNGHPKYP